MSDVGRSLKILGLCPPDSPFWKALQEDADLSHLALSWEAREPVPDKSQMKKILADYQMVLLDGDICLQMDKLVNHRSVGSHFLNYIDFIENKSGVLWGHSLFSKVFRDGLLGAIKNQDYKGSVIFLGDCPRVRPTLDVLTRFGFEDFVFLRLDESETLADDFDGQVSGLLSVEISAVDSIDFLKSQKAYSFCFVLRDHYDQQILEDMSYFHFLSNQSMVFDLSGKSNFLFKEVRALGVDVVESQIFSELLLASYKQRILDCAQEVNK